MGTWQLVGNACVGACQGVEPRQSSDERLALLGDEFGRQWLAIHRDLIDDKAGEARGRRGIAVNESVTVKELIHKSLLRQVSGDTGGRHCPLEEDTEEPGCGAREIDLLPFGQSGFEPRFDRVIGGTMHEVVHVASHTDRGGWKVRTDADEDAGVMDARRNPPQKLLNQCQGKRGNPHSVLRGFQHVP